MNKVENQYEPDAELAMNDDVVCVVVIGAGIGGCFWLVKTLIVWWKESDYGVSSNSSAKSHETILFFLLLL